MAVTTGTVTGRFEDMTPGAESITGSVYFTAEADYLISDSSILLPKPVKVDLVGSAFSVDLVATDDPTLNPVDWTYKVTFDLAVDGARAKRDPFSIKVPAGVVTDLSDVSPVAASKGNAIIVGPTGPVGPQGVQGPSLNVGQTLTVTGPAGTPVAGPMGPMGPKGDPGGITNTVITSGQDLNSFTTSGLYVCGDGNFAQTSLNYPLQLKAGQLLVMRAHSGLIHQTYFVSDSPYGRTMFQRSYASAAWQPWRAYQSSRVDQTAGRVIYQWDDTNQREQIIYGDTGVRRVETLFVNGWTCAIASLRRVNNVVQLGLYSVSPAAQTGQVAYTVPNGFRPGPLGGNLAFTCRSLAASGIGWVTVTATGDIWPETATGTFNGSIQMLTWTTTDAWPTTLPGTSSGSVPNV